MIHVRKTIRTDRLSPRKSTGRPPVLTLEQEEELATFACSSHQEARQISYLKLAVYFQSWNIGQDATRNALKRRSLSRYVA
ncbi:hypothetical protein K3495_g8548 [Podosphaera aphanis]|nr:hypothetical protein K3495_g8548 [Podosphaera aphanis]